MITLRKKGITLTFPEYSTYIPYKNIAFVHLQNQYTNIYIIGYKHPTSFKDINGIRYSELIDKLGIYE